MILADKNVIIKIIQAGCLIDFFRGCENESGSSVVEKPVFFLKLLS